MSIQPPLPVRHTLHSHAISHRGEEFARRPLPPKTRCTPSYLRAPVSAYRVFVCLVSELAKACSTLHKGSGTGGGACAHHTDPPPPPPYHASSSNTICPSIRGVCEWVHTHLRYTMDLGDHIVASLGNGIGCSAYISQPA